MFASTTIGHVGSGMMGKDQYSIPSESISLLPKGHMRPPGGLPQLNSLPHPTNPVTHKVVGPRIGW